MTTLARRCLILGAVLWLGAACGGAESPSTTTDPNTGTGTTPPASGTAALAAPGATTTTTTQPPSTVAVTPTTTGTAGTGAKPPTPTGLAGMGAQIIAQMPSAGGPAASGSAAPAAGTSGSGVAGGGASDTPKGTPTLFWLAFNSSQVMMSKDMKTAKMFATTGVAPDGVAIDVAGGMVYWTNMGSALGTGGGTVQSAKIDGSMVATIVPAGVGTTFKQTTLDLKNKKLYWGDREGRKLWRADLPDGKNPEAIVSAQSPEVVGVVVDSDAGKVYFTDRTGGHVLRTNIDMPAGATAETRKDIETVLTGPPGSNPIDLEIDHVHKALYWTDRTLGTVHRMELDKPETDKVIVPNLSETIGIAVDPENNKIYFTELGGTISSAALDGTGLQKGIIQSNGATGCALVYMPN